MLTLSVAIVVVYVFRLRDRGLSVVGRSGMRRRAWNRREACLATVCDVAAGAWRGLVVQSLVCSVATFGGTVWFACMARSVC